MISASLNPSLATLASLFTHTCHMQVGLTEKLVANWLVVFFFFLSGVIARNAGSLHNNISASTGQNNNDTVFDSLGIYCKTF